MVLSSVYFGEKYTRPHGYSLSIIAAPSYNHNQSVSKTGLMDVSKAEVIIISTLLFCLF
jgi:hypothetical protein